MRCESGVLGAPRTAAGSRRFACSTDWRTLTRLWRTDERFQELWVTHSIYKRIHRLWRARRKVGDKDVSSRPKRFGIGCQNLRA